MTLWEITTGLTNREPPEDVVTDTVAASSADEAIAIVRVARRIFPADVAFLSVSPRPPLLALMTPEGAPEEPVNDEQMALVEAPCPS